MKKSYLFGMFALAALTMVGCSNDEVVENYSPDNAIEFGTYMGNSANGRASIFETSDLKGENVGFGVYAYYTGQTPWASANMTAPNFMNNTQVTFNGDAWTYKPLKYWPNTPGDKVSFFAYAPWTAGGENDLFSASNGIISFEVANAVESQIDLTAVTDHKIDQTKKGLDQVVEFQFQHVLSRIEFTLQAAADQVAAGGDINEGTIITLDKIVIGDYKNPDGTESVLDKFYETANYSILTNKWNNQTGRQFFTLLPTNFVKGNNILSDNKTVWTDNGTIAGEGETGQIYGNDIRNLIDTEGDDYIMIIPQTITDLPVYVEYTVKTVGKNAAGEDDNATITNKITTIIKEIPFEQGKAYKFNLVLGMSTVELSAEVTPWGNAETVTVDLPLNTETSVTPDEGDDDTTTDDTTSGDPTTGEGENPQA